MPNFGPLPVAAAFGVAVNGYTGMNSYRGRLAEGQNKTFAAGMETLNFLAGTLMNPVAYMAMSMGSQLMMAGGAMVTRRVIEHSNFIRHTRTPFSHRFEHTDATAAAQQYGLSQIGNGWGLASMGSEAAKFAQRYGRG